MATGHEEFNEAMGKKEHLMLSNKNVLHFYRKNLVNKDANNKSVTLNSLDNKQKTRGDVIFHRNMRVLVLCGQFLGLNPFLGILGDDTSKLRFNFFSYKVLYSIFLLIFQMASLMLCWHKMFEGSRSLSGLAEVLFYAQVAAATCMFLRIAMEWPTLVQDVAASKLEEYMDPRMMRKCNIATVVLLSMAMAEHSLSLYSRITAISDSQPPDSKEDIFRVHIQNSFKFLFELGIPYNTAVGILCQVYDLISSMTWNFSDVFIICMSFYLSSILEMINKKIETAKRTQTSLQFWKSMREDYSRATQLVQKFDDVISGVIFSSFAGNLFFLCLQLHNILALFNGYEKQIYLYYSFGYILVRALLVSLIAANVHSVSNMVAPTLYELPPSVYCEEVQRFIDQVHNEIVALSGLQFFYVTKELILTVGATIVTYELVLLQMKND